jgi:glycosyltransferase involved in cell wall biosynthesis
MRIVQVAPFEESVPPKKYGGIEVVIYNLTEELVKQGHEVYLLASGDSQTSAHLVPTIEISLRNRYSPEELAPKRDWLKFYHTATVLKKIREIKPDIVHNHLSWRFIQFSDLIDYPLMTTCHGPLNSLPERFTFSRHQSANYISISDNQRRAMPELNWIKTVYNGIAVEDFEVGARSGRDDFLFLGRTSPEKGLKEICQLILKTSFKLKIAAKVDTVDEKYFNQEIKPLIDGRQIEFIGEVGHQEKVKLLKQARALLLWLNWEEPFGLVVTEAMACGTPVIVNKRGSMPELVEDGKTGFLVDSLAQMQAALKRTMTIKPQACRQRVEQHFSATKMAANYAAVAEELVSGKNLHEIQGSI